jgi:hypothetical protein
VTTGNSNHPLLVAIILINKWFIKLMIANAVLNNLKFPFYIIPIVGGKWDAEELERI